MEPAPSCTEFHYVSVTLRFFAVFALSYVQTVS